jgi:long-chain acyl-CoA synthetase
MLYDCWRRVANEFAGAAALTDVASGRAWSFRQLAAAAEEEAPAETIVFPQTNCADFVLQVLRGWRCQRVVCPLEPGQARPVLGHLPPTPIVHLKTTSATGGQPRLVAFTGEQLAADAQNIVKTMGLRPEWPNLAAISLAHSYGF